MNIEQLIKMIDAGYTKEEIEKMTDPKQEPKPEPKAEQEPKPEPKAEHEPKPESKQEQADDPVLKELQDLKKAVYAMNIMQSNQPPKSNSVDDILAKALKEG